MSIPIPPTIPGTINAKSVETTANIITNSVMLKNNGGYTILKSSLFNTTIYDLIFPADDGGPNSVLVNDGGGVLSWGSNVSYNSAIIVNQSAVDAGLFDNPIDSTKVYFVDGNINIDGYQILVPSTGIQMDGFGFDVSSITLTDTTKSIFISPVDGSGNILIKNVSFSCTGAGSSVFAVTDATGFNAIEFTSVNFNDCVSLGYMDGYRQGLENNTGRFGGTPDLEFRGTWVGGYFINTSIVRSIDDSTYSLYKCAIGQTFASRLYSNANILLPANVTGFECTSSNFTTDATFQLTDAIFSGAGTPVNGIDETNTRSKFKNCVGVENTYVGGYWNITATALTTFSGVEVKLLAGTTTYSDLVWFSGPSNNALTVITTETIQVRVQFVGSFTGGNNKLFTLRFRYWDDSASAYIDGSTTSFTTNGNGKFESVTLFSPRVSLTLNDRVEVWVLNITDNTSVTADVGSQLQVLEY